MSEKTRYYWDKRADKFQKQIKGVLFKSLPDQLNLYLHEWMYSEIKLILPSKNTKLRILDLGCGYGRIAKEVVKDYPRAEIYGIDVSKTYVKLYNQISPKAKAKTADVRKIPHKKSYFDIAICVTTLMYMNSPNDQEEAIKELFRVLKPKGKFIIIEPNPSGQKVATLGKGNTSLSSTQYTKERMSKLIKSHKGEIVSYSGIPLFSLTMPFLYLISTISGKMTKFLLQIISKIDDKISTHLTLSMYISYKGRKRPA